MCLNYHLSTFAEAKAKPVAARPERSGTATSEGHAQIISIILQKYEYNLFIISKLGDFYLGSNFFDKSLQYFSRSYF